MSLLALSAIPVVILYFVARSGIMTIPFMAPRVQHDRAPLREVIPVPTTVEQLAGRLVLEDAQTMTLRVTEQELTGALRSALAAHADVPPLIAATMQVVMEPQRMEVYAHVPNAQGDPVSVRLRVLPKIVAHRLVAEEGEIVIGNLRLPGIFARAVISGMLERIPELRLEQQGRSMEVESWELHAGQSTVRLRRVSTP